MLRNKKIILASNTSWYIYNLRLGVIKHLQSQGCEIIVIAPKDDFSELLIKEGCTYFNIDIDNKGTNPIADIKFYFALKHLYKQIKPDFVFHYTIKPNIYGSYAANAHKIPSVAIVSGAGHAFIKKNLVNALVKKMYAFAAKKSLGVWFVNKDDQEQFTQAGIVPVTKTKVLPGEGINLAYFNRNTAYPKHDDNSLVFLLTARLLWDKGVGVYADAARIVKTKHPNAQFWLLGFLDAQNPSAIEKEQIDAWHNEGIINFLGSTTDVKSYLEKVDCYILPSHYREGVPRSLLEAASMCIPIITTNNVGCKEVVDDGVNGFLCNKRDVGDLVNKIEKMIAIGKEKREQIGLKGRQKVEREFDEKLVVKYYSDILKTIFNQ